MHIKTYIFTVFCRPHSQLMAKHPGHASGTYLHFCCFKTVCFWQSLRFSGSHPRVELREIYASGPFACLGPLQDPGRSPSSFLFIIFCSFSCRLVLKLYKFRHYKIWICPSLCFLKCLPFPFFSRGYLVRGNAHYSLVNGAEMSALVLHSGFLLKELLQCP